MTTHLAQRALELDAKRTRRNEAEPSSHGTMSDGSENPDWFVGGLGGISPTHLKRGDAQYIAFAVNHCADLARRVLELEAAVEAARAYQRMLDKADRAHLIAGWREYAQETAANLRAALDALGGER